EGGWEEMNETIKLTASDGAEYDYFGYSVSISGDQLVVGAYFDDDKGSSSGSAYLFEKPDGGWVGMNETAKLTASDGTAHDYFGAFVSISEDLVVVGAYGKDENGVDSGSAYLFEKPEGGWE
ncbi:FG-GAP repeat protein, partial [Xanthovirga aplysinae]|uniref:FG-GAP repeat protein n=1 Tax=Xanthovirga aplysinae TaxID=2529853 RepID=UPI00165742D7